MGYCAVADVQAEFKSPNIFDTTSFVTSTAVAQFIVEASALIDSMVGSRYTVPITGTSSLSLMQYYCRTIVANRVRGILSVKQTTNVDANQQVKTDGLSTSDVLKLLRDIQNGVTTLADASLLNPDASFFSNNSDINAQPRFRKNTKAW